MSIDESPTDGLDFQSLSESFENTPEVETWLNSILDESMHQDSDNNSHTLVDLIALDRRVSNLLASLEIVSEDTSTQLERIMDDISRGAPRLTYDLHFMKEGAVSLQNSLQKLQQSTVSADPSQTQAALERLHDLDTIKKRMEAARDVLREAESWSTLESEILSLLSEQNYEKAAETLSEAAKSMIVFQNTPEYETRRSLMVSLQNQLEASLSSALVAAINSQDVTLCKNYFSIFCNIQRESEFRNYYYGSRRTSLVTIWQKARFRDVDSDITDPVALPTFATFLPAFFASFLTLLEAERISIPSIFPDPQATLSSLISSVLSSLQPTLSQRLPLLINHYGPSVLIEILSSYTASVEFAVATENVMEKIGYSAPSLFHQGSDESDGLKHRRRSKLSMSRRIGQRNSISVRTSGLGISSLMSKDQEWQQQLFEPFLDYQVEYGSLEQKFLADRLDKSFPYESGGKARDGARLLKERSVDVFSLAEQSLTRCMSFTYGFGVVGLIRALEHAFRSVIDTSKDDISASPVFGDTTSSIGGGDLSDMDYTAQDWSRIQMCLHMLEAARGFHDRLVAFENKLRSHLIQVADILRAVQSDIYTGGRSMSGTTVGAMQILAQSTLNSVELQDLLKPFDSDPRDPLLSAPPMTPRFSPVSQSLQPSATTLLTDTRAAVSNFARTCQGALQRTILSPLHKHLSLYANSAVWSSQGVSTSKPAVNELHVPVFSTSPTDTIQRVAEGLLNLPRLFEVYADDDALSFSIETLPFVDEDLLKSVVDNVQTPGEAPATGNMKRSPAISFRTPTSVTASAPTLTPEAVSSAWLSSLALSLLSFLTSTVLPGIKSLSTSGAAQLSSDLAYLSNVVQALNVRSEDLERWKELAEMDEEEGKRQVKERGGTVDHIFSLIARIRGWN